MRSTCWWFWARWGKTRRGQLLLTGEKKMQWQRTSWPQLNDKTGPVKDEMEPESKGQLTSDERATAWKVIGWRRWVCFRRDKRSVNWKEFREPCSFREYQATCVITLLTSTSSLLIISNCVYGDRLPSQWSSRQPGLLPKSTHTHPISTDWIKEEQQAASPGPRVTGHRWMNAE